MSGNTSNCRDHIARFHSTHLLENKSSVVETSSDNNSEIEIDSQPNAAESNVDVTAPVSVPVNVDCDEVNNGSDKT